MLNYSVNHRSVFGSECLVIVKLTGRLIGATIYRPINGLGTGTYLQLRLRTVRTADITMPANEAVALRRNELAAISQFIESGRGLRLH